MSNKTNLTTQICVELVSAGRETCEGAVAELLLQAPSRASVSMPKTVVHDQLHSGAHRETVYFAADDHRRARKSANEVERISCDLCKVHPSLGFNIEVSDLVLYGNVLCMVPRVGCGPFTRNYYEQAGPIVVVHVGALDRTNLDQASHAICSFMEEWGEAHGVPLRETLEYEVALAFTSVFVAPSAAAAEDVHAAAFTFGAQYVAAHPFVSVSFDCDVPDASLHG